MTFPFPRNRTSSLRVQKPTNWKYNDMLLFLLKVSNTQTEVSWYSDWTSSSSLHSWTNQETWTTIQLTNWYRISKKKVNREVLKIINILKTCELAQSAALTLTELISAALSLFYYKTFIHCASLRRIFVPLLCQSFFLVAEIEIYLHINGGAVRLIKFWFMTLLMVRRGSMIVSVVVWQKNYSCWQKESSWKKKKKLISWTK